jgi:phospholipid/cholesterol/gamma-HCH transport system substrate-binding protein
MARERYEIQVGIALVVAVLVLLTGLLWFKGYRFNREHMLARARFQSAGGLGIGDPVHVRGIPMGKVTDVELDLHGVIVSMSIERRVVLTDDARFFVGSQGIVGERLINIEPGIAKPLGAPDLAERVFDGEYELALSELAGRFDTLNANLLGFLERMTMLLVDLEDRGGIGPMLEETTRAAQLAAKILGENAGDLRSVTKSMKSVSANLEGFMNDHGKAMGQGVDDMAAAAARMDSLITQLSTVAQGTNDLLTALREQDGTLGKLIYDEKMRDDVQASVDTLRKLVADILAHPERYLKIEIF